MAAPAYIPTNSIQGFPFLLTLDNICYLLSFGWQPFWQAWGAVPRLRLHASNVGMWVQPLVEEQIPHAHVPHSATKNFLQKFKTLALQVSAVRCHGLIIAFHLNWLVSMPVIVHKSRGALWATCWAAQLRCLPLPVTWKADITGLILSGTRTGTRTFLSSCKSQCSGFSVSSFLSSLLGRKMTRATRLS